MEAKRIPGKKGRSKRERVEELTADWILGYPTVSKTRVLFLDSPDEPDEEDVVEVRMSVSEAKKLGTDALGRPWANQPIYKVLFQALDKLDIDWFTEGGSPLPG